MHSRLNCLTELINVTRGRVPDELTGRAGKTLERARQRLRQGEQIAMAFVGSVGSGKSSLTSVLVGSGVAEAGVLHPTAAETLTVNSGDTSAELLDQLRVGHRQEVPARQDGSGGLALPDLPGHDSMVSSHRAEVGQVMPVVDQFIWALDPQKYADVIVHHGYLGPLSRHGEVVAMVLNQVDWIRAANLNGCLVYLRQLLDSDGLAGVPLFATSTATGVGTDASREHLANVIMGRRAARTRLSADLDQLTRQFEVAYRAGPEKPGEENTGVLEAGLVEVAGVPRMIEVAAETIQCRGVLATGWPTTRWAHRLRSGPLERPRIGLPGSGTMGDGFVPDCGSAATAQLRIALHQLPDVAGNGLGEDWQRTLETICQRDCDLLLDLFADAVMTTDLGPSRIPG